MEGGGGRGGGGVDEARNYGRANPLLFELWLCLHIDEKSLVKADKNRVAIRDGPREKGDKIMMAGVSFYDYVCLL